MTPDLEKTNPIDDNNDPSNNDETELAKSLSLVPGITRTKTKLGETYIVGFDGPEDPYNPQNWPWRKK